MKNGKFEIEELINGQFYYTLKAGNGEVLQTSEMLKTKQSVFKSIRSVRWNALWASIVDKTK